MRHYLDADTAHAIMAAEWQRIDFIQYITSESTSEIDEGHIKNDGI